MTKSGMAVLMSYIFNECQATREDGQKEYAHADDNAFRNFEETGKDLGIEREKVLWIFLNKHLDGIKAYLNGHKSQREDVRGRIKDAIVYLCLLWGMIGESEGLPRDPTLTLTELETVCENCGHARKFHALGTDYCTVKVAKATHCICKQFKSSGIIKCCERDHDCDGNCDVHSAPGKLRNNAFAPELTERS